MHINNFLNKTLLRNQNWLRLDLYDLSFYLPKKEYVLWYTVIGFYDNCFKYKVCSIVYLYLK